MRGEMAVDGGWEDAVAAVEEVDEEEDEGEEEAELDGGANLRMREQSAPLREVCSPYNSPCHFAG